MPLVPETHLGRSRFACAATIGSLAVLGAAEDALAGDVAITRKGHKISITAGDGDDTIVIAPSAGKVLRVSPNSSPDTTIDGGAEGFVTVGSLDTVVVNLGGGQNKVFLTGVFPRFKLLSIRGGAGPDTLAIDAATLPAALQADDVAGGRFVDLVASQFGGTVVLKGGDGADTLVASACDFRKGLKASFGSDASAPQGGSLTNCTAEGGVVLVGGAGADSIRIAGGTYRRPVSVNGGTGDDTVVGAGNAQFVGPVTFKGGGGSDLLQADGGADFKSTLKLDGGADGDTISVHAVGLYKAMNVLGGDGNDGISVSDFTSLEPIQVICGAGSDTVAVTGFADARRGALLDGGTGTDTLTGAGAVSVPGGLYRRTLRGFESVSQ